MRACRYVLSSFNFKAPNTLLLYHCALAVALVEVCRAARLVRLEPLRWPLIRLWLPVNLLFVGMLVTSFYALEVRFSHILLIYLVLIYIAITLDYSSRCLGSVETV